LFDVRVSRIPDDDDTLDVASEVKVTINGEPLILDTSMFKHSPTGFNYGYGGSGPAQLAGQLMYEFLRQYLSSEYSNGQILTLAKLLYQDFKWSYIASKDQLGAFTLDEQLFLEFLRTHAPQLLEGGALLE